MVKIKYAMEQLRKHLDEHGLSEKGWNWRLGQSKRYSGLCWYKSKYIIISRHYLECPKVKKEDILNTIIHEVAHALTYGHSHDEVWKAKAKELGWNGRMRAKKFSTSIKT